MRTTSQATVKDFITELLHFNFFRKLLIIKKNEYPQQESENVCDEHKNKHESLGHKEQADRARAGEQYPLYLYSYTCDKDDDIALNRVML